MYVNLHDVRIVLFNINVAYASYYSEMKIGGYILT